jgi:hypothetical protein
MKITTPDSMAAELAAWNDGRGIDLDGWINCMGSFSLAVGYASVFWPLFSEYDGYVLRDGFSIESLRGFEAQTPGDRRAVEAVMNHLHVADLQYAGCPDLSRDKIIILGEALKEIHEVKLRHDFPHRSFEVSFWQPDDPEDLLDYQLSFWQR